MQAPKFARGARSNGGGKEHGIEKFGRLIYQNIAKGHYLNPFDRG